MRKFREIVKGRREKDNKGKERISRRRDPIADGLEPDGQQRRANRLNPPRRTSPPPPPSSPIPRTASSRLIYTSSITGDEGPSSYQTCPSILERKLAPRIRSVSVSSRQEISDSAPKESTVPAARVIRDQPNVGRKSLFDAASRGQAVSTASHKVSTSSPTPTANPPQYLGTASKSSAISRALGPLSRSIATPIVPSSILKKPTSVRPPSRDKGKYTSSKNAKASEAIESSSEDDWDTSKDSDSASDLDAGDTRDLSQRSSDRESSTRSDMALGAFILTALLSEARKAREDIESSKETEQGSLASRSLTPSGLAGEKSGPARSPDFPRAQPISAVSQSISSRPTARKSSCPPAPSDPTFKVPRLADQRPETTIAMPQTPEKAKAEPQKTHEEILSELRARKKVIERLRGLSKPSESPKPQDPSRTRTPSTTPPSPITFSASGNGISTFIERLERSGIPQPPKPDQISTAYSTPSPLSSSIPKPDSSSPATPKSTVTGNERPTKPSKKPALRDLKLAHKNHGSHPASTSKPSPTPKPPRLPPAPAPKFKVPVLTAAEREAVLKNRDMPRLG